MFCKKLGIAVILFAFFLFNPKSFASQNFHTSYSTTYTLTTSQKSHVAVNVVITNNTTKYFVSAYKMQFGFSDLTNLSVTENSQKVPFKLAASENGTQLEVDFKDKVVGISKKRNFIVSFDTNQISQNLGSVWEVNIPAAQKYSSIDDYNALIIFPQEMGKIAYVKPNLKNINFNGRKLILSNNSIKNTGLSIAFGDYQIYDFNLTYHLKNGNFFPISQSISLPSNNSYQEVLIDNISPKPTNVQKDKDGNWIASYQVPSAKNIDVKVQGKARVFLTPKPENITQDNFANYLKPQTYWETYDPKISELGKKLKTPQAIYRYVVSTLNYDFSKVKNNQERLGASKVLSDPSSATCREFTDLFIALSRAAGIPAREVVGYAYSDNSKERPLSLVQDILHAWPEYYDSDRGTWVYVDPTWGNTTSGVDYFSTIDFDHVAFVTQGSNSNFPTPPGGFGDIKVSPGKEFNPKLSSIAIEQDFEGNYISGFPITGKLKVENNSNSITPQTSIIASTDLNRTPQNIKIDEIPPFGNEEVNINMGSINFLTKYQGVVKIQLGSAVFYETFKSTPIFTNKIFYIGVGLIGIFIIGLFIGARLTRRLSS